jgi:predicted RNase H-like HicB family nuclease
MIELPYTLVIEATEEPDYFGFYSPELEGFSGIGHSVEDCLHQAKWGMKEHVELLRQQQLPVPPPNPHAMVTIQNDKKLAEPKPPLQPTARHDELHEGNAVTWPPPCRPLA